eukprot:scaffold10284_cov118-Isochrysis_galbana.AAC.11
MCGSNSSASRATRARAASSASRPWLLNIPCSLSDSPRASSSHPNSTQGRLGLLSAISLPSVASQPLVKSGIAPWRGFDLLATDSSPSRAPHTVKLASKVDPRALGLAECRLTALGSFRAARIVRHHAVPTIRCACRSLFCFTSAKGASCDERVTTLAAQLLFCRF